MQDHHTPLVGWHAPQQRRGLGETCRADFQCAVGKGGTQRKSQSPGGNWIDFSQHRRTRAKEFHCAEVIGVPQTVPCDKSQTQLDPRTNP